MCHLINIFYLNSISKSVCLWNHTRKFPFHFFCKRRNYLNGLTRTHLNKIVESDFVDAGTIFCFAGMMLFVACYEVKGL